MNIYNKMNNKMCNNLMNMIGEDCENIILDYVFELENDERVENHKESFNNCLEEINYIWCRKEIKDLLSEMDYFVSYRTIGLEFSFEINDEEILISGDLNNPLNWVGGDAGSGFNLLYETITGWRIYTAYENKIEYVEDAIERNGYADEDDYEIYEVEYESMEIQYELIEEVFNSKGYTIKQKEILKEWAINEM